MNEMRRGATGATYPAGGEDSKPADRRSDDRAVKGSHGRHASRQGVPVTAYDLGKLMSPFSASPLFTATRTLQAIARGFSPFTAYPPLRLPR